MKPSVTGWKLAKSVSESHYELTDDEYTFERAQNKLSTVYLEEVSSKKEKKSVIGQLFYHAMMERMCES